MRAVWSCGVAAMLIAALPGFPAAHPATTAEVDANARAAGSDRAVAVTIGRALFAQTWPAQVMKVRVDGIGPHLVAGVVLSGVKLHHKMKPRDLEDEALAVAGRAFDASRIEEADVWATVPIDVQKGIKTAGDFAQPVARTVFGVSLVRGEAHAATRVHAGTGVFWAPDYKARLEGGR